MARSYWGTVSGLSRRWTHGVTGSGAEATVTGASASNGQSPIVRLDAEIGYGLAELAGVLTPVRCPWAVRERRVRLPAGRALPARSGVRAGPRRRAPAGPRRPRRARPDATRMDVLAGGACPSDVDVSSGTQETFTNHPRLRPSRFGRRAGGVGREAGVGRRILVRPLPSASIRYRLGVWDMDAGNDSYHPRFRCRPAFRPCRSSCGAPRRGSSLRCG